MIFYTKLAVKRDILDPFSTKCQQYTQFRTKT